MQAGDMTDRFSLRRLARLLGTTAALALLGACNAASPPPQVAATPAALPPPPKPLTIVDPPVRPGGAVAVVRGGEPRPVVAYQQPDRLSPPGEPVVLPPPIPRGDRQETLVEAVPTRIVLGGGAGEQRRFVSLLNTIGTGRFDALHLEFRSRSRGAVRGLIGAARRAGVDPLKIHAVDVPAAGGAVEVIVTRYTATAPVCPSQAIVGPSVNDNDFDATSGCSNRANLAAMVNDPADLLGNASAAPADGSRAAYGIERYRMPGSGQGNGRQDGSSQGSGDAGAGYGSGPLGGTVLGPGGAVSR